MGEGPKESKKEAKRMASMCAHQRQRRICKECKGSSICEHQRQRSECKECGGSRICQCLSLSVCREVRFIESGKQEAKILYGFVPITYFAPNIHHII